MGSLNRKKMLGQMAKKELLQRSRVQGKQDGTRIEVRRHLLI